MSSEGVSMLLSHSACHCAFYTEFISDSGAFVFSACLENGKIQLSSLFFLHPLTWMGSLTFYMGTDILMSVLLLLL